MTDPRDFEPTDEQVQSWINEHAISGSKEELPVFIARKAAWHAADIEMAAWNRLLIGFKLLGASSRFSAERRPPPPQPVIERDGYVYNLAPGQ